MNEQTRMDKKKWIKNYAVGLKVNRSGVCVCPREDLQKLAEESRRDDCSINGYWTARIHGQYLDVNEINK